MKPKNFLLIIAALAVALIVPSGQAGERNSREPIVMAENSAAILDQLKSRGAKITITTKAQVMRRAGVLASRTGGGVPVCGENACMCTGAECLDVISSNKCDEDTWHCVPSDKGPVCVCAQK